MSTVQEAIQTKLQEGFSPVHLEVINESHLHNVPAGSESHFKVVVVAEEFATQKLLERHRAVNRLLQQEIEGPVHALSIHALTPEEWFERGGRVTASPPCMGGSKRDA